MVPNAFYYCYLLLLLLLFEQCHSIPQSSTDSTTYQRSECEDGTVQNQSTILIDGLHPSQISPYPFSRPEDGATSTFRITVQHSTLKLTMQPAQVSRKWEGNPTLD